MILWYLHKVIKASMETGEEEDQCRLTFASAFNIERWWSNIQPLGKADTPNPTAWKSKK